MNEGMSMSMNEGMNTSMNERMNISMNEGMNMSKNASMNVSVSVNMSMDMNMNMNTNMSMKTFTGEISTIYRLSQFSHHMHCLLFREASIHISIENHSFCFPGLVNMYIFSTRSIFMQPNNTVVAGLH